LLFFAGLFVLVEVCAAMGLLEAIGEILADYIGAQEEDKQLNVAIYAGHVGKRLYQCLFG
jgi:Na+/H+ antiporter NhaD/arsenite permease-like protein